MFRGGRHAIDLNTLLAKVVLAEAVESKGLRKFRGFGLRTPLWRGLTTDKVLGAELKGFSDAVRRRFGEDTVRAMLRAKGGSVDAASVPRAHQAALGSISQAVHTLRQGERADDAERLTQRQTLGLRSPMRP
jgi:hypothetical protein